MKKFDKSKIMQLAHQLRKREGYTMSQALTLAWDKARRSEFYMIVVTRKPQRVSSDAIMQGAANYYASKNSGSYIGD